MLNNFKNYLLTERAIKSNYVPYYVKWVGDYYSFLNIPNFTRIDNEQKNQFLSHMAKEFENWQVKQSDTALGFYDYFLSRQLKTPAEVSPGVSTDWIFIEKKMQML